MKRILLTTTALFLTATAAIAQQQGDIIQSPAYKECIALSSTNPQQALAKADEWLAIDNGIAAHHCRAMALYGLRRYNESAEALNGVRKVIPPENIVLRSFVTKQAVQAYLSANHADAAYVILDTQIGDMNQAHGNNAVIAKQTSGLLLERAKLNVTYGKYKEAAQDLDHAVSLTPVSTEVLLERARAFELMGDSALARADAESALVIAPDSGTAKALIKRLDAPAPAPLAPLTR